MRTLLPVCFLGLGLLSVAALSESQDAPSEFARGTIDIGVVVSDLDKSVEFYTDLIGFKEVSGFSVGEEFCREAGLTDGHPLTVRVLVLTEKSTATRLKLMSLPKLKPQRQNNDFVHSQYGFSYLTLHTNSLRPSLTRLEKAGIEPVANGPVPLPGADASGPHLAVVRDPDGNLVELIGVLN